MKLFLPVHSNGSFGSVTENEADAKMHVPDPYYSYGWDAKGEVRVWPILSRDSKSFAHFTYYNGGFSKLFTKSGNPKIIVVPPLLDIRSNSKTFPTARKVVYCAIKGISPYGEPFGGALEGVYDE